MTEQAAQKKPGQAFAWPGSYNLVIEAYWQDGSPSPAVLTVGFVVFTPIPQTVPDSCVCEFVATHAPGYVTIAGAFVPVDCLKPNDVRLVV